MKKKYISPTVTTSVLSFRQTMLAGSATGSSVFNSDADPDGEVLSRRHSLWEDDSDDDF